MLLGTNRFASGAPLPPTSASTMLWHIDREIHRDPHLRIDERLDRIRHPHECASRNRLRHHLSDRHPRSACALIDRHTLHELRAAGKQIGHPRGRIGHEAIGHRIGDRPTLGASGEIILVHRQARSLHQTTSYSNCVRTGSHRIPGEIVAGWHSPAAKSPATPPSATAARAPVARAPARSSDRRSR